jgi:hypothetical protein
MQQFNQAMLAKEAEIARQNALSFLGRREASVLLKIAREFDDLASRPTASRR